MVKLKDFRFIAFFIIQVGVSKILEEIFAKETKNQLGRKSTVRILSENALTGKEIIF